MTDSAEIDSLAHAPEGRCGTCHHPAMDHWRNPSCRSCRCSRDPICSCGELSSKHVTPR